MKKILLIVLIIITLTGCYGNSDINKLAYLMAIGIDNGEYTFQFANPINFVGKENGFGSEAENSSLKTVTVSGDSLFEAFSIAQSRITKTIDTSYLKLLLFNKLYKNGNIGSDTRAIEQSPNFHKDVYVAICETPCKEFLDAITTPLEINPAKYYENIFNTKYNEYSSAVNLKSVCNKYVIIPVVTKNKIAYKSAVVKDGMITEITDMQDGKMYNIISGNLKEFGYFLKNPKCDLRLYSGRKPVTKLKDNTISVKFTYDCEILENTLETDVSKIKETIKKQLTADINNFYEKYYKDADCDLFYYKKLYKKRFLTNHKWEKFNSSLSPKQLNFKVTVEINSDRNGERI
ncbi:MAG: hypothetical protein IJM94_00600 [Clostridia bacterium]|nr:hypothetical protein [Clostridia bacterium]